MYDILYHSLFDELEKIAASTLLRRGGSAAMALFRPQRLTKTKSTILPALRDSLSRWGRKVVPIVRATRMPPPGPLTGRAARLPDVIRRAQQVSVKTPHAVARPARKAKQLTATKPLTIAESIPHRQTAAKLRRASGSVVPPTRGQGRSKSSITRERLRHLMERA